MAYPWQQLFGAFIISGYRFKMPLLIVTSDDPFRPLGEYILGFGALLAAGWIIRRLKEQADKRLQNVANNWPCAYGRVEHAEAKIVGNGKTAYWVGELAYSYAVDGNYHSGLHRLSARSEDQAWKIVRGWKDRKVVVHYLPSNPFTSILVLKEQDQPPDTEWADENLLVRIRVNLRRSSFHPLRL